jgi:dihydroxyacid dehydratase/phosphogluconate dehydratase
VLYGNIALDGCIVKTAGVDEHPQVHRPCAHLRKPGGGRGGILADRIKAKATCW